MKPIPANKSRVLVAGDIFLDRYYFGEVHRISPEAPVPILLVKQTEDRLGGAANVANNICALGTPVTLLGIVGNDAAADEVERLAQQRGITAQLCHDETLQTTIQLRLIGRTQQLLRIDIENTPEPHTMHEQLAQFRLLLPEAKVIVLADHDKGALADVSSMISAARSDGTAVVIDPGSADYQRYAGATIIVPNRSELADVVGAWRDEAELITKAQNLREKLQCQALLLTRSTEGMTLFTKSEVWHVPAQTREVYDVSGAGDTVVAALAAMLAIDKPLKEAVSLANRAAGIVVGKIGTATVSKEELFGLDNK